MKALSIFILITLSTTSVFAGPGHDTVAFKDVVLTWKATDDINELKKISSSLLENKKIKIEKFTDARKVEPKEKVGENIELADHKLPVLTKSDVSEFVTNNFKLVLEKAGAEITEEKADYVLSGEIKEYFIEEKDTYRGILTTRLSIKKNGKEVWSGKISETNKRFGRSYKLDNYMESLSDCIVDFTKEFLSSSSLEEKIK